MNSIQDILISNILPPSIIQDETAQNAAKILDDELLKLTKEIEQTILLPNIDSLDEQVIDLLAEQFNTPYYKHDLELTKKRALVKDAINWHKKKGTVGAVEELISVAFSKSRIEEWHKYGGEPYRFKVLTTDHISSAEKYIEFHKAIEQIKNTRSWLESLTIERETVSSLFVASSVHIAKECHLKQSWISLFKESTVDRNFRGHLHIARKITLKGSE